MSNHFYTLERALSRMSAQFESQSNRVLSILTNPENINAQKLRGAKPRIFVFAEINWNNDLVIVWGRQTDEGSAKVWNQGIFYGTDYVAIQPTWPDRTALANAMLCFQPGDYSPETVFCDSAQDRQKLENALELGLVEFLAKLTKVCEVSVLSWPAYSAKGTLKIANLQRLADQCVVAGSPAATAA